MGRNRKLASVAKSVICEKFKNGSTVTELANEYQVSRNTIKNYLKESNLWEKQCSLKVDIEEENVRALLESDKTATELSKELGCSLDTIRRKRLKLEGKKDVPKTKREHYVEPEVKGGIRIEKRYKTPVVEYEGKKYVDITELINNLNDIL